MNVDAVALVDQEYALTRSCLTNLLDGEVSLHWPHQGYGSIRTQLRLILAVLLDG